VVPSEECHLPETTANPKNVLVVGRKPKPGLASQAELNEYRLEWVVSGWEALERVESGAAPDFIVLDSLRMELEALHTLRWLRRIRPALPVVLLGMKEDFSLRQEAVRAGAHDCLFSTEEQDCWQLLTHRYLQKGGEFFDHENPGPQMEQVGEDLFFVTASPLMSKLRAQIELLAQVSAPVLIIGEPGSGKDVAARLIHKLSVRSGSRFAKINCSNLPADLLQRELFGDGNAQEGPEKPGKFELCKYGTLFLEGIAHAPVSVQAGLMQRLQEHSEGVAGSARVLAASDASIRAAVGARDFREDLYYRLSVFTLSVPPLRERREEIPILFTCFLNQLGKRYGLPTPVIPDALREVCRKYQWPGNLRELEIFAKRYLVTGNHELAIEELQGSTEQRLPASHLGGAGVYHGHYADSEYEGRASGLKWLVQSATRATERNAIVTALSRTQWNRKAAARLLKVSYRTLLYKIERYRLSPPIGPISAHGSGNGLKVKPAN
jgi:DNA-binding NtrC family response regulator